MSELGKIRGHAGQANSRAAADASQRASAEKAPRSVILGKNDVQGEYDVHRVLTTTLDGNKARSITSDDLVAFRRNMQLAQKKFKGDGITARQVIDLASSRGLEYAKPIDNGYYSDIDKAKREIRMSAPVSAMGGDVRFITSAGVNSKVTRHHVLVRFNAFAQAANKLMSSELKDTQAAKEVAGWLRKQKLAFDCDCERHRYFLRYVATIGNFNAGRPEHGFPKIRNPKLKGVACKHVLRTMAEIESSPAVLNFMTKHMDKVRTSANNTAKTQKSQEAFDKETNGKKRPSTIKTSAQLKAEANKAKEARAASAAAQNAPRSKKTGAASRNVEAAIKAGTLTQNDLATFRKFGMSDAKIAAILKAKG